MMDTTPKQHIHTTTDLNDQRTSTAQKRRGWTRKSIDAGSQNSRALRTIPEKKEIQPRRKKRGLKSSPKFFVYHKFVATECCRLSLFSSIASCNIHEDVEAIFFRLSLSATNSGFFWILFVQHHHKHGRNPYLALWALMNLS
ncbi:DNA repair protein RecO [Striga asiatica]|uniref:DNA repair protein RecO n=1 Tax=Striga asiatica TaxID=4170 RepID=A0A5A7NZ97_STRAF|nr:DNA repair protein RecO [Striga asiatica]